MLKNNSPNCRHVPSLNTFMEKINHLHFIEEETNLFKSMQEGAL
jgi:hypothetical protein